jgi:peptidoglycan/xylan/chitin deacetylase (PgdA/CDA1 family)
LNLLRALLFATLLFLCACNAHANDATTDNGFHVLNYHDVYAQSNAASQADSLAVSVDDLVRHFSWLRDNGYRVVSVSDIIASRAQGTRLPDRAIMITFDDGYASFATHVLPLLKLFNYPATLAVVGGWIESPATSKIEYESDRATPNQFMSWAQIREAANSGLVHIASHTYDSHHGEVANPQGTEQPSVTARIFNPSTQQYESDSAYRSRIRSDLKKSSDIIEARTGKRPRVVVWPYGAYNKTSAAIASELGMSIGMSLDTGINDATVQLSALRRVLIRKQSTLIDMVADLQPVSIRSQRVLTLDTSRLFDSNAAQFQTKLSQVIDRVAAIKPRSVIISATDGQSERAPSAQPQSAWIDNSVLPVAADQLNRATWQIRTRAGARVFVKLPHLMDSAKATTFARELGQRAQFAGVVFDHENDSSLASSELQLAAIRESQVTAESVYRIHWPDACEDISRPNSLAVTDWRAALSKHSWVAVNTDACSAKQWRQFAAFAQNIPGAMQRTLVEHAMPEMTDSAESALRSLEHANANGFRHLGAIESTHTATSIETLRRAVSVETYPLKR